MIEQSKEKQRDCLKEMARVQQQEAQRTRRDQERRFQAEVDEEIAAREQREASLKQYLAAQYGEEAVEMMRVVKHSLDPLNILNPGKVIDC